MPSEADRRPRNMRLAPAACQGGFEPFVEAPPPLFIQPSSILRPCKFPGARGRPGRTVDSLKRTGSLVISDNGQRRLCRLAQFALPLADRPKSVQPGQKTRRCLGALSASSDGFRVPAERCLRSRRSSRKEDRAATPRRYALRSLFLCSCGIAFCPPRKHRTFSTQSASSFPFL